VQERGRVHFSAHMKPPEMQTELRGGAHGNGGHQSKQRSIPMAISPT